MKRLFNIPESDQDPSVNDEIIQTLENQLSKLEDDRLEERFYWVFAIVFLLDIIAFNTIQQTAGQIFLFLLSLTGLLLMAYKCRVDIAVKLLGRVYNRFLPSKK